MSSQQHAGSTSSRGGWYTSCCVLAYSFSFVAFGLQVNLLGPTVSAVASKLHQTPADLGLIYTVNGLASIVGAMPSGYLVDKMPGHLVLAAALAFEAVGFLFIPLCSSMLALTVAFGCVALSWNIINTAGNTYVLWIAAEAAAAKAARTGRSGDAESSSVLINTVNAAFGAGSLAAPVVAELCASALRRPLAAYWVTAALTALSAASFLLLPSPKPPGSSEAVAAAVAAAAAAPAGADDDADDSLQQPLLLSTPAPADAEVAPEVLAASPQQQQQSVGAIAAATAAAAPDWRSGTLLLLLGVTSLFNLLNVGTEVGFGAWIFTYATQQAGLSEHEGHAVNATYWGLFTVGRVCASFAALVLSPSTLLFASLPLGVLGALLALLAPAAVMQQQGWLLLCGVTVLVGLGASAGFANSLALLDSYCPCTGSITGLLGGVAGAGCMTVPLVVAMLAKHTRLQYQALMVVTVVSFSVQLVCVPLVLLVGGRLKWEQQQCCVGADDAASVTKFLGETDGSEHDV